MRTLDERFWAKVDKKGPIVKPELGPCWVWKGGKDYHGYGKFAIGDSTQRGKDIPAHRFAYEQLVGTVPEGKELDHLCRNPPCVNPAHLEPVTRKVNAQRGKAGRWESTKTHCPKGHPYDLLNTYFDSRGKRMCRTCRREQQRKKR